MLLSGDQAFVLFVALFTIAQVISSATSCCSCCYLTLLLLPPHIAAAAGPKMYTSPDDNPIIFQT
jgi:hypothetical protein